MAARLFARSPRFPRIAACAPRLRPALALRSVASSVSMRPGSQTLDHALLNAKEEAGNSATDLAKTIAGNVGAHLDSDSLKDSSTPLNDTFFGITGTIAGNVPNHVLTMGLAGALPYLGTSVTTVYLARQAGLVASGVATGGDPATALALLNSCMSIQITYGAVLISFAGALHWGMEFAAYNGYKGYPRLFLGATPVVFAWSTLALDPAVALIAQWFGYTALWYADMKATSAGWTPKWYSQYRFYLSILVGTCIMGTLAGTFYLGPAPGRDATHYSLEQLRAARRESLGDMVSETSSEISGPIEAVATGSEGDAYIKITKKKGQAETGGEKSES